MTTPNPSLPTDREAAPSDPSSSSLDDQNTAPVDQVSPDDTDAPETQGENDTEPTTSNREAAKWRTKLRAAEAERDGLAAQVDTLRRAEVERLAGSVLTLGADLFEVGGHDLAEVLDENGNVDPDAVLELSKALQLARPGLSRHGVGNTHHQFGQSAGPVASRTAGASWSKLLRS